jgi:hypothetical protein
VRAGVVTDMVLDADPARGGLPRARVNVRLTPAASALLEAEHWEIVITTSPLPGFKAEVAFLRSGDWASAPRPDGEWRSRSRSAVAAQVSQAFDELVVKLREAAGGGELSLRKEMGDTLRSLARARDAVDGVSRIVAAQTARKADGTPGELEELLNRMPERLTAIAGSLERAGDSSGEILDQTAEVLRKADVTLAYINQFLTGLKRNWVFRGAFNEDLEYEDLAPFLVPNGAGED